MRFLGNQGGSLVVLYWSKRDKKKRKPEVANESQQPKWSTDARLQNDL